MFHDDDSIDAITNWVTERDVPVIAIAVRSDLDAFLRQRIKETLLKMDLAAESAAAGRFLDVIVRHSARLEALSTDLLDLSRLEAAGLIPSLGATMVVLLGRSK